MSLPHTTRVQDMPPPAGYPKLQFGDRFPRRGPSGTVMWSVFFLVTAVSLKIVANAFDTKRVLRREQEERRLAIAPFLQAESDITTVESMQRMIDEQSYIMREVTDFNPTLEMGKTRHVQLPTRPQRF